MAALRAEVVDLLGVDRPISNRAKIIAASFIFILSFAIRSLHAVDFAPLMYTGAQPMGGLTRAYDERAMSITAGKGLLIPDDQRAWNTGLLAYAPGYALYLGAVYALWERNFFIVQLTQNAINSLTPVLLLFFTGMLLGWRVGVVAGLLAAVSHHLAYYSNFILPDAMSALPVVAAACLLARAWKATAAAQAAGWRMVLWYGLAGVLIGLSAWLRQNTMMLAPFAMVLLAFISTRRRREIRYGAVMVAACVLTIAPITIRNYLIYRQFVPIGINFGIVLWEGLADAGGERFGAVRLDDEVGQQEVVWYDNPQYGWWASPDGIQRDRDRVRRSLGVIAGNPGWYAGAVLGRMEGMLKYTAEAPLVFRSTDTKLADAQRDAPLVYLTDAEQHPEVTDRSSLAVGNRLAWLRPAGRALQRLAKETMQLFVLLGVVLVFAVNWRLTLFILIVPLYNLIFHSLMHWEFRYTMTMHYFLFIFAAAAWVMIGAGLVAGIKRRRRRQANDAAGGSSSEQKNIGGDGDEEDHADEGVGRKERGVQAR